MNRHIRDILEFSDLFVGLRGDNSEKLKRRGKRKNSRKILPRQENVILRKFEFRSLEQFRTLD